MDIKSTQDFQTEVDDIGGQLSDATRKLEVPANDGKRASDVLARHKDVVPVLEARAVIVEGGRAVTDAAQADQQETMEAEFRPAENESKQTEGELQKATDASRRAAVEVGTEGAGMSDRMGHTMADAQEKLTEVGDQTQTLMVEATVTREEASAQAETLQQRVARLRAQWS